MKHLDNMAKVLLTTGSLVGLAYGTELFMAWYSGNPYERFTFMNRAFGPHAWWSWGSWLARTPNRWRSPSRPRLG